MIRKRLGIGMLILFASSLAQAQTSPNTTAAPSQPNPEAAPPAEASRAEASEGSAVIVSPPGQTTSQPSAQSEELQLPTIAVEDPMLEPVAPPPNVLKTYQQALRLVRSRSTSLAITRAQVEQAAADARLVLSRAYPRLTASGNVQHSILGNQTPVFFAGISLPDTTWTANLSLTQPLVNFGTWYDIRTAKLAESAAGLTVEDQQRRLLAAVADSIVSVVTAERLSEIRRLNLAGSLRILNLTRRRAELGAGNALDVLRSEQEVAANRRGVIEANESLRQAREALGMALGYPDQWGVAPNITLDELAQDARRLCRPLSSIEERADVRAATERTRVAKRQIKSTQYDLAPTLDLVSDFRYTSATALPSTYPIQWTIGALLTIPLYDGGVRIANRRSAAAQAEQARQQLFETERQANLEVQQARRAAQVADRNYEVARQARDIARETSRLTEISFINGQGTSFELVEAQQRYQQAEIDIAVAEFEVVRTQLLQLLVESNCDLTGRR